MGACLSAGAPPRLIEQVEGDEAAFHQHYYEDEILGEGEFGVVKLVRDTKNTSKTPFACKILRKGMVFKHNTLYTPLKPEILQGEVNMLRALNGECYCLKLKAVYESARTIYIVTDYYSGGEMMEYISKLEQDLTTEDVSRISFQLLSAVNHCAKHHIINRDIKPENTLFETPQPGSPIRLIDFGSGVKDDKQRADDNFHTTFAGSAFYISPEMFQHKYNNKTDVWSTGVLLYVLVAGYPADCLQKAFNVLQVQRRNLRDLPNMPDNMPESYFELLEGLLTFRFQHRPSAGAMLQNPFVQFHKTGVLTATATTPVESATGRSMSVKGSVGRHSIFLNFKRFERSLTTLLATMLTKKELEQLLVILKTRLDEKNAQHEEIQDPSAEFGANNNANGDDAVTHRQKLSVVKVAEIKDILTNEMDCKQAVEMMQKMPSQASYDNFAYHVALLQDFGTVDFGHSSVHSQGRKRVKTSIGNAQRMMNDSSNSARSSGSIRARKAFGMPPKREHRRATSFGKNG